MDKILLIVTLGDVVRLVAFYVGIAAISKIVLSIPRVKAQVLVVFEKLVDRLPDNDVKIICKLLLQKGL